jgi:hypothetical protein
MERSMKGYQYTFRAISRQQEWSRCEWSTGEKFLPPIYHSKQLDERWTETSVVICHTLLRIYKLPFFRTNLDLVWNRRMMIRLNTQQQFLKFSDTWQLVPISLFEPRRPARNLLGEVVWSKPKELV